MPVGVRRVHDRRARTEATGVGQELDGSNAVLGDALLDLARLFVRVHVQRQCMLGRVGPELAQRLRGTGAHGVGGDADCDPIAAQRFELTEILGHGALPEALHTAAQIARVEADERNAGFGRGCSRCACLVEPEIVELADRGVAVRSQLAIDLDVLGANLVHGQGRCE